MVLNISLTSLPPQLNIVLDEILCFDDGGVAILTALTSRVTFNLTVQVVYII